MESIIYLFFTVFAISFLLFGFFLGKRLEENLNKHIRLDNPTDNRYNPFHIPDLTPMYEALKDFIKEHQGDKGYILTDNDALDPIWSFVYDESEHKAVEVEVKAVQVDKHGCIKVIVDDFNTKYDDKSVSMADKADTIYGAWLDLQYDDNLFYIHTVFSIAESIQEYV